MQNDFFLKLVQNFFIFWWEIFFFGAKFFYPMFTIFYLDPKEHIARDAVWGSKAAIAIVAAAIVADGSNLA
jgi:hypothetical protein